MKKYLYVNLLIFISGVLNIIKAQDKTTNNYIPEVFSPAPNAYEIGKYGTYPVDLSTGVPDITIPIYTIKEGDIENLLCI